MKKEDKKPDKSEQPAPPPPASPPLEIGPIATLEGKQKRLRVLEQQRMEIVRNLGVTEGAIAILNEEIRELLPQVPRNRAERRRAAKGTAHAR